ncbi:MAG: dTDP-4-dehydrorhamnose reductase [Gemmatimonadota bacterium]
MRIGVTGAGGQLGRDLVFAARRDGHEPVAWSRRELDVTIVEAVRRAVEDSRPDVVVHAAAYTAVDRAERERELAFAVNAGGTEHVALACAAAGVPIVYVSTDYVFDGSRRMAYRPDDGPCPLNVYGASKLEGERRVQGSGAPWLIVRTSWVYGRHGTNFVKTVLRLARERDRLRVVADQVGSPTSTATLARALVALAAGGARGILHVTDRTSRPGAGGITWHEFACAILRIAGSRTPVDPISSETLQQAAVRPPHSVLDVEQAESFLGRSFPDWEESLTSALPWIEQAVFTEQGEQDSAATGWRA